MFDFYKTDGILEGEGHSVRMSDNHNEWRRNTLYSYTNPLDAERLILGDKIIDEIAATKAFQRLKSIKFLGGIDYAIVKSPNTFRQRYTRFQHSLGVANLSALYACVADLTYKDRRLLYVSALLHDIGHAPLSHSLEEVFSEYFGIDHHIATEKIIKGDSVFGPEILNILNWHNVNVEEVISLINRKDERFCEFFSGPINFDTIEGILRTYSYVRNTPSNLNPHVVTYAASVRKNESHKRIVDEFWRIKGLVYNKVITSPIGVLSDFVCKKHMVDSISKFSAKDYFISEPKLFKKLPGLRETLINRDRMATFEYNLSTPISFKKRTFYIDDPYDFYLRQDNSRYKQSKTSSTLLPRKTDWLISENIDRSMFDDDAI